MAEQLFQLKNLRTIPVDYDFSDDMTKPCRVIESGKLGQYFGTMYVEKTKWAIVLMSGCFKPDFIQASLIEILELGWVKQ
jgi:hypothetical protein